MAQRNLSVLVRRKEGCLHFGNQVLCSWHCRRSQVKLCRICNNLPLQRCQNLGGGYLGTLLAFITRPNSKEINRNQ